MTNTQTFQQCIDDLDIRYGSREYILMKHAYNIGAKIGKIEVANRLSNVLRDETELRKAFRCNCGKHAAGIF